jgi:hypothetical protein
MIEIYIPSPLKRLKDRYIQQNKYLKKSFEKMIINRDTPNIEEIYNDIRSDFDEDDEWNARHIAECMVYSDEKDFFFLQRDMRFSFLTLVFHTFEKNLKKFLFKNISDVYPQNNNIIEIILKDFCFNSTTYNLFKFLDKICNVSFTKKVDKIRNLVNAFKHNENKTYKCIKEYLKDYRFFEFYINNLKDTPIQELLPISLNFEEEVFSIEPFLYITKDELFSFIDDIIRFWKKIPILKDIDSEAIYNQIKEKKGTQNDRHHHRQ